MNDMDNMKRCWGFIETFGVTYDDKAFYVNSSHNSIVMNRDSEWGDFAGYSVNDVVRHLAYKTNRKVYENSD